MWPSGIIFPKKKKKKELKCPGDPENLLSEIYMQMTRISAAPFPLSPDEGFSHRSDSESNLWAAEYESRMGAGVQQGLGEAPGLFSLKKKRSQIKEAQRPVLCGDDLFFVFSFGHKENRSRAEGQNRGEENLNKLSEK